MESIKSKIIELRPNLSKQSVSTYNSILKNLYKKVFDSDKVELIKFNDSKKILEYLKTLEPTKRKTVLSALVVLTDKKDYREQMLDDIEEYNKEQHKQVKNDKQNESWVDGSDISKIIDAYKKEVKLIYKKEVLKMSDLQIIQNYVILCLLGGVYIPPRRSKDYVDFKIKNIDKSKDNYISKNKLVFNSYKTAKTYGKQEIEIPTELKRILNKWVKVNPTDYLLFDSNSSKLSNVKLNQRLNKMFGNKKVGVNQMRKSYLSKKYSNIIDVNKELENDFSKMGSSKSQFHIYVKKDT